MCKRRGEIKIAYLLPLVLVVVGCGTTTAINVPEGKKLNIIGALSVEKPTNKLKIDLKDKDDPDFDLLSTLKTNLESELKNRCFKVAKGGRGKYVLKTAILKYEPGSAFKRWLVPGWGATKLQTKSTLVHADNGKTVAEVNFDGNVTAGGGYTMGAYKYIASWMGEKLAAKLRETVGGPSDC